MAAPTWAENATQLKNGVKCFTDLIATLGTFVTDVDNLQQDLEGDHYPDAAIAFASDLRGTLTEAVSRARVRGLWDAWANEALRIAGVPERVEDDPVAAYARVARYMHEQSFTFNDRNWTRGAASAGGGNVGTGTVARLTVDWEGYNIQGGHVETKTLECSRDQNLGVLKGAEMFEVRGEDRSKDLLDYQGSGIRAEIYCMHAGVGTGGSYAQNSSFDSAFVGSDTAKVPGWTIGGTAGNVTYDSTDSFCPAPGSSVNACVVIAAAAGVTELTQLLTVKNIDALGERTPWMMEVAYKKSSAGATGTLNLKMGSKTTALDLSTVGDTNWHVLQFTIDKNVYYRNWKQDAPDLEIEVDTLSAGTLKLDAFKFAPWTRIDWAWLWVSGGATAFLQRDSFTIADSGPAASTSEMMFAADWAGVPVNLPSNNAGGETITDP